MAAASSRKQAINIILDDFEAETGLDAPKLPDDAFKTWQEQKARKHRMSTHESHAGTTPVCVPTSASTARNMVHHRPSPRGRQHCALSTLRPPSMSFVSIARDAQRTCTPALAPAIAVHPTPSWYAHNHNYTLHRSPPQEWCAAHGAQVIALQLPGRALRRSDPHPPSMQALAQQMLSVMHNVLSHDAPPYVVRAGSRH